MSEGDALYRTVCEHPDDDAPRLVYADWLQENGDEHRAEFIRLQCRLDGMPIDHPEYAALTVDEQRFIDCHAEAWTPDADRFEHLDWQSVCPTPHRLGFRRGFQAWPEWFHRSESELADLRSTLKDRAEHTPVRDSDVCSYEEIAQPGFLEWDEWRPFSGLELQFDGSNTQRGANGTPEAERICSSDRFANLRRLYHKSNGLGDRALFAYARTSSLPNLTHFGAYLNEPCERGLKRFAESPLARQLRSLQFWGPSLGNREIGVLCESPWPGLEELYLEGHDFGAEGIRAVARSNHFPDLRRLTIRGRSTRRADLVTLVGSKFRLAELDLSVAMMTTSALSGLTSPRGAGTLRILSLPGESVTEELAVALASAGNLRHLRRLDIGRSPIGGGGLKAILSGDFKELRSLAALEGLSRPLPVGQVRAAVGSLDLPELRHLDLSAYQLAVKGAEALARRRCLSQLLSLRLVSCGIRDRGAELLLNSPHLQRLEYLDLSHNPIKSGVGALADPGVLPRLIRCDLSNTTLDPATTKALSKRPGVVL